MQNPQFVHRAALIGCGNISVNHLNALAETGVEVVALCDIRPEKAEEKKARFGLSSRIYTDWKEMLDKEKNLTAVHICTPHYLHALMTVEALKRGLYVFLEKPMATSEEEINAILEAEKASDGKVCVCFQNRFNPTTVLAKQIADEDGGVISGHGIVFWQRDEAYYSDDWHGKKKTEGGGVLINQAIHTLDLLIRFLGKPVSVTATTANHHLKGIIDVEDAAEGLIRFENGKRGSFAATNATVDYCDTEVVLKTAHHIIRIIAPDIYVDGKPVLVPETAGNGKAEYGASHNTAIAAFYRAIENGDEMPIPAESAQWALRLLLAAYRSGDTEIPI